MAANNQSIPESSGRHPDSANCNHSNIICDKIAGIYGCADCGAVTGHFETYAPVSIPRGMVSIGNGLYARTRGGR